jgi:uncharacterized protein (DUF427 family)
VVQEIVKATWNGATLAESDKESLIYIEGNWYFPVSALRREYLKHSSTRTTCAWKGEARYYDAQVGDQNNADAAWYYPQPKESAIATVKKDFTDYVAFWRGVTVQE